MSGESATSEEIRRVKKEFDRRVRVKLLIPSERIGVLAPWRRLSDPYHLRSVSVLKDYLERDEGLQWVVDLPLVYRMERCEQLPFVHISCPTAEHSRAVHSIGTAILMAEFCRERGIKLELAKNAVLLAWLHDLFEPPFGHGLDPLIKLSGYFGEELKRVSGWPLRGDFSLLLVRDFLGKRWELWNLIEEEEIIGDLEGLREAMWDRLGGSRVETLLRLLSGRDLEEDEKLVMAALSGNVIDVDRADYLVRDYGMIKSASEALWLRDKVAYLLSRLEGVDTEGRQVFRARDDKEVEELVEAIDDVLRMRYLAYMHYYEDDISIAGDETITHLLHPFYHAVGGTTEPPAIKRNLLKTVLLGEDDVYYLLDGLGESREYKMARSLLIKMRDEHRVFLCLLEIGLAIHPLVEVHIKARELEKSYAWRFMEHVKRFCTFMHTKVSLERRYAEGLIEDLYGKGRGYNAVYKDIFPEAGEKCRDELPLVFINLRDFYTGGRGLCRWRVEYLVHRDGKSEPDLEIWTPPNWGFIRLHIFVPERIYKDAKNSDAPRRRLSFAIWHLFELLTEGLEDDVSRRIISNFFRQTRSGPSLWTLKPRSIINVLREKRPYVRWCGQLFV